MTPLTPIINPYHNPKPIRTQRLRVYPSSEPYYPLTLTLKLTPNPTLSLNLKPNPNANPNPNATEYEGTSRCR